MDFGLAVMTFETAGMVIRVLLLRGFVGSPTFGAGEYYCGLRSAVHLRSMLPDARGEQCCRRQVGMQPIIVLASAMAARIVKETGRRVKRRGLCRTMRVRMMPTEAFLLRRL